MTIADLDKIKKLLETTTAYRISKATGIGETTISRWTTGKTPLEKMSFENDIKLTQYANEREGKIMNAKEILEQTKNNEVQYAIVNDKGDVYCNRDTNNIMDIYGLTDEENGHFYGVYGDAVGGQIDSRNASDEVILQAIEFMLTLGKAVRRSDLNFSDFKRTYYQGKLIQEARRQRQANQKCQEWLKNHKELVPETIIEHKNFGKGKIIKVENLDKIELATIYVDFENKGNKRLALASLIENNLLKFL